MDIRGIDPRDTRWELLTPSYRVYFWDGGISDEVEVSGADVAEVLAWADAEAIQSARSYVLFACREDANGPGLIRLAGWEGPSGLEGKPAYVAVRP